MLEMVKAAEEAGVYMITDVVNQIIVEGIVPAEWELSTIVNFYKEKGDAVERGNHQGLKLTDHILKIAEGVMQKLIKQQVNIAEMRFGFMPGCRTRKNRRNIQQKRRICTLYL